jgi:hypothetical protein
MCVIHDALCVIKINVPALTGDLHSYELIKEEELGSTIRKEATVAYFKVLDLLLHAIKQKNS